MVTRLSDTNEIKIFILYVMQCLNKPMKYEEITEVAVQDGMIGGIDFADCFADLIESGNIRDRVVDGERRYELSPQGRMVAENLQDDIPKYVRSQGLKAAFRLLNYKERGSKISVHSERREDGKFDLCCQIIDERQLSLEIKIVADSADQLELMARNFDDRPEVIYRGVMALLCGNVDYLTGE